MMKKQTLLFALGAVLLFAAVQMVQKAPAGPVMRSDAWEYGVYRIGGYHEYEWQSPDKHIYGKSLRTFFEMMEIPDILAKLDSLHYGPKGSVEYAAEIEFLNYLGGQGWELVHMTDRGPAGIANRTFWFKRLRQ